MAYTETSNFVDKTLFLLHFGENPHENNPDVSFNQEDIDADDALISRIVDYLNEGAIEISNRIVQLDPAKAYLFSHTKEVVDNMGVPVSGDILGITRESGNQGELEPCTAVSPLLRFRVKDTNSLEFRSVYNPVYYIMSKKDEYDGTQEGGFQTEPAFGDNIESQVPHLYILPTPDYSQTTEFFHRGYVTQRITNWNITDFTNMSFVESGGTDHDIRGFARQFQYLLPLYASIRIIDTDIVKMGKEEEDIENIENYQAMRKQYHEQYESAFVYMGGPETGDTDEGASDEG